jgi:lipopolysaccharide export system permease protein
VLCFAILGAPRTSRQSREVSIIMTVLIIGALRLIGFACNVVAAQSVAAVYVLWGSILLTFAAGIYAIARGAVIEPPAFLAQLADVFERMTRRLQPA